MKKILVVLTLTLALATTYNMPLFAGEIDILVDKLVEKGILTSTEAQIVLDETKQEVAKEVAQGKSYSLPSWVQKIKLKGDFRARYQFQEEKSVRPRHRERIRFRLGMEADVVDKVKVGAGFATGGTDPRSTNQTLTDTFSTPDIRLDYAFAEYKPFNWASAIVGKFKRKPYLWVPSDLLWDSDINPEGVSIALSYPMHPRIDMFGSVGAWILDETAGNTSEPYMIPTQVGLNSKLMDNVSLKNAATFYFFDNVKGAIMDNSSNSNTRITTTNGNVLRYNYNSIALGSELGIKNPLGEDHADLVSYLAGFEEYVHNVDTSKENNGWLLGVKFGDKKVKKKGTWQAKYMYRRLEQDAWLDTFPDSDFYSGETGVKGHELMLNYAVWKNVILGVDYYHSKSIKNSRPENLIQFDAVFKF